MTSLPDLTEPQIRRYARHIVLAEIGGVGQARLIAARVLVVGAGGLVRPCCNICRRRHRHVAIDRPGRSVQPAAPVVHRTADIKCLF
jgi:hypothetical protein